MNSALRLVVLAALPLALAACQGEKKTAQQGTAEGEILPASASDAMLPYDTVRSQPPLAPMPTDAAKGGKPKHGVDTASDAEEAADAGPGEAPVEEPAPAAKAAE